MSYGVARYRTKSMKKRRGDEGGGVTFVGCRSVLEPSLYTLRYRLPKYVIVIKVTATIIAYKKAGRGEQQSSTRGYDYYCLNCGTTVAR